MTWEWSHTIEGMHNVCSNIARLSREDLEVIYAEWKAAKGRGHFHPRSFQLGEDCDLRAHDRALGKARLMDTEVLVDKIWDLCSTQALCSNGGWEAYVCPYGCPIHRVSFDHEEREKDE